MRLNFWSRNLKLSPLNFILVARLTHENVKSVFPVFFFSVFFFPHELKRFLCSFNYFFLFLRPGSDAELLMSRT